MGKEGGQVHNNKHARKGGTIRNTNHGLERHHWCNDDIYAGLTHAVNYMRVLLSSTKNRMSLLRLLPLPLLLLWSW